MNEEQILEKINGCFGTVFTDDFSFSKELARENFEQWDSMHHINLMVELERAFGIRFDGAAATVLTSVDNILTEVKERIN